MEVWPHFGMQKISLFMWQIELFHNKFLVPNRVLICQLLSTNMDVSLSLTDSSS
jgi:hypothetical protein